jgi:uncharacterized protein (TIGR02118 family)
MVKTVVLYKEPADKAAFDNYYFEKHIPLVKAVPGIVRVEICKFTGGAGGPAPYYLMAEMWFNSAAEMNAAWSSPEGRATGRDVRNFVTDPSTITMAFAEIRE